MRNARFFLGQALYILQLHDGSNYFLGGLDISTTKKSLNNKIFSISLFVFVIHIKLKHCCCHLLKYNVLTLKSLITRENKKELNNFVFETNNVFENNQTFNEITSLNNLENSSNSSEKFFKLSALFSLF